MEGDNDETEPDRVGIFVQLLAEHEQALSRYTIAMVPYFRDSDDILQDAKLIMWKNFDEFEIGTNFGAWAKRVIFFQILKYRRQPERKSIPFSEGTLKLLEADLNSFEEVFDRRRDFLSECLKKLSELHSKIVSLRYNEEYSIEEISNSVDKTTVAVYQALSRIRKELRECVSKRLEKE